jgi:hypothetical protein
MPSKVLKEQELPKFRYVITPVVLVRVSMYGLSRTFRVLMDLLTILFMKKFLTRPMHVFGLWGLISMLAGAAIALC